MKTKFLLVVPLAIVFFIVFGFQESKPEVCIASYSTTLEGRSKSQIHNCELSARKINGIIIAPGETFSFNEVVGSWSRYEGYRKAPVSFNGQLIRAWGGGVCQTSTTLYNTALLSGMKIEERHRHTFAPDYVPPGRDAAVAYKNIDLRFTNLYNFPITIKAKIQSKRLIVEFYASETLKNKYKVINEIHNVKSSQNISVASNNLPSRLIHPGKPGFEVTVWREVASKKGTVLEKISHDTYPSATRVSISSSEK